MLKPNIPFKTKKWTCKQCGLLKDISKGFVAQRLEMQSAPN